MKSQRTKKLSIFLLCFAMIFLAFSFLKLPQSTFADDFTTETRSDQNFSLSMTATGRQNSSLPLVEQEDESGNITYLCFKWRDLRRLNFHITSNNQNLKEGRYCFKVTHSASEKLTSVFTNSPSDFETNDSSEFEKGAIYKGYIGDFVLLDLYYNIDSELAEEITPTNFAGHDYGLYKFDFIYSVKIGEEFKYVALGESIYVAVLPDTDIKERLESSNLQIVHSVSSSNRLVNIYNLTFSNDALKYIRPDLITWVAYGKGIDNTEYCLTQQMKDLDIKLANCTVIWECFYKQNGSSFVLDTKEIEGTWQAYCIIKDYNGEEYQLAPTEELSTIKVQPKNFVWLILLILGASLLLLLIIAFVIMFVMKKKEKMW